MGRYCFFTTGFEYKFAFGVQESSDILLFGGEAGVEVHTWTQKDIPFIAAMVKDVCDFEKYDKNLDGTYELEEDLEKYLDNNLEIYYTLRLGCFIYHQLLYTDVLTCEYEY